MENSEEIWSELIRFNAVKEVNCVPALLDDYLRFVARCGHVQFAWPRVCELVKYKLDCVIDSFVVETPPDQVPAMPNVEPFKFAEMRREIHLAIDRLSGTPFTIQRLCELITDPFRYYKRIDKYMRAVEKCVLVVTVLEQLKRCDSITVNGEQAVEAETVVVSSSSLSPSVDQSSPSAAVNGSSSIDTDSADGSGSVVSDTEETTPEFTASSECQLPSVDSVRDAVCVAEQNMANESSTVSSHSALSGSGDQTPMSGDVLDARAPDDGGSSGKQFQCEAAEDSCPVRLNCVDMEVESEGVVGLTSELDPGHCDAGESSMAACQTSVDDRDTGSEDSWSQQSEDRQDQSSGAVEERPESTPVQQEFESGESGDVGQFSSVCSGQESVVLMDVGGQEEDPNEAESSDEVNMSLDTSLCGQMTSHPDELNQSDASPAECVDQAEHCPPCSADDASNDAAITDIPATSNTDNADNAT